MSRRLVASIVVALASVAFVSGSIGAPPGGPPAKRVGTFKPPPATKSARLDSQVAAVQKSTDAHGAGTALVHAKRTGLKLHGNRVIVMIVTAQLEPVHPSRTGSHMTATTPSH